MSKRVHLCSSEIFAADPAHTSIDPLSLDEADVQTAQVVYLHIEFIAHRPDRSRMIYADYAKEKSCPAVLANEYPHHPHIVVQTATSQNRSN